ncbi:Microtubule-associated protein RP/EB member 3 [Bulinus truncatus]|nr:Microtubule-associated protein RP/EB member 3 [Bulinus truncatus]
MLTGVSGRLNGSGEQSVFGKQSVSGEQSVSASQIQKQQLSSAVRQPNKSPASSLVRRSPGAPNNAGGDNQVIEELKGQIEQLNIDKEGLEKERDFYFNKLREIEVICQDNEGLTHIKEIMDILYATEEGFAPPEDDPELDGGEQEEY